MKRDGAIILRLPVYVGAMSVRTADNCFALRRVHNPSHHSRCGVGGCGRTPTHVAYWVAAAPFPGNRFDTRRSLRCDWHASGFARKHGLPYPIRRKAAP